MTKNRTGLNSSAYLNDTIARSLDNALRALSFLRARRRGDLLQELAGTTEAAGEPIGMFLLEGRGKIVPVTVILLERPAMILHHVARIGRIGPDDPVDAALGGASSADDIGNMNASSSNRATPTRSGIDGYCDGINYHPLASWVAVPFEKLRIRAGRRS